MSQSHFGILDTFDHNSHSWESYKNRLKQWFIANDLVDEGTKEKKTEVKKRAILLSALSDATYKLAASLALPKELQDLPYVTIIQLLDDHFVPKVVGFGNRYQFYAATQNVGESFTQWAARLRGLTAHCSFRSAEEALRDRFLMGMLPGPEREKLFAQKLDELTLAKAVEVAENMSSARATAAAASANAPAKPGNDDQLFKIAHVPDSASARKVQCSCCGYKNHSTSQCRFASYKCTKCKKTGHLRRMCKKINYVENAGEEVDCDDDGELFNIRTVSGEPMSEVVLVHGISLRFQVDSGSAVTAIPEKMYKQYFRNIPLSVTNKKLITYVGSRIDCLGLLRLDVNYANNKHTLNVYVIRNGGPPLLGRDFISRFKLEMSPINFCTQESSADVVINYLQTRFPLVFSDSLGKFNKYKVTLHLKENAEPVFAKARPVAYALRERIDRELDRLTREGILEPVSYAEYASPVVPVLKRNGTIRLCADFSITLNRQLKVDQYPLPSAQELFARLHNGQQFSKLDLSQAYTQFELDDESQNLCCINTHRGLFKYKRLAFGLASAPAIFQRAMECILSGIDGVLCMLDDILITGSNKEEHMQRLLEVLNRLQDAGLTLQRDKCEFFQDQVEYLGHTIDRCGLKKSPQKIKAIESAPIPTNVNQLMSFLGLVNYYRNFVPQASTVLAPLYELLQKNTKWQWSEKHTEAFNTIKAKLISDQVLAHFNPNARIILTVDASPFGLGAILSQIGDDGVERPVAFASRTLNKAEKRYAQIQKEATAIIFGVRRFHQYLYGRSKPFVLKTDHKPLLSIFGPHRGVPEVTANRLQRYAMFLSAYNYEIEYVRSSANSADYLSRACVDDSLDQRTNAAGGVGSDSDDESAIVDRASYVNFVIDNSLPTTLPEIREETQKDLTLMRVVHYILNGWPRKVTDDSIKPYFLCKSQLAYENGCVMRGHRLVVPGKLRERLLTELHQSHLGVVKTKAEARGRFWYPGLDKAVETMIASCATCIQLRQLPPRAPLAVWPYPSHPFHRIHIDFLGPINNHIYLVIVDAHSKWVEVYRVSTTSSAVVILKLYDFMARFGLPKTIVSDNGTAFVSQEFQAFCLSNGITHVTSPAYHPASNGQAESFVKIIKKGIKASILSSSSQREHEVNLQKYLFDYRNSMHTTTGRSPAELVFGHKLRSRLDLIKNSNDTLPASSRSPHDYVKEKQCLQVNLYGGKNAQQFKPGDWILYKDNKANKKGFWNKGIVIKKIGNIMYQIQDCTSLILYRKHKNQLLAYKGIVPPSGARQQDLVDAHPCLNSEDPQQEMPDSPARAKSSTAEGRSSSQEGYQSPSQISTRTEGPPSPPDVFFSPVGNCPEGGWRFDGRRREEFYNYDKDGMIEEESR